MPLLFKGKEAAYLVGVDYNSISGLEGRYKPDVVACV